MPIKNQQLFWLILVLNAWLAAFSRADSADGIYADFQTTAGDFTCKLEPDLAPRTVAHFIGLVTGQRPWLSSSSATPQRLPFYNGAHLQHAFQGQFLKFGQTSEISGCWLADETSPLLLFDSPGVLAMDKSATGANSSGIFITLTNLPERNGFYTPFGRVTAGLAVVQAMGDVPVDADGIPVTPVVIQNVNIRRVGSAAAAFDIQGQSLPTASASLLSVSAESNRVKFTFANAPYVDPIVYSSTDLIHWASCPLGIDLATPALGFWSETIDSQTKFFQLAKITYPNSTLAPRSLTNLTIFLSSRQTNFMAIQFDTQGHAFGLRNTNTPIAYSWRQGAYGGWLVLSNLPGYHDLCLRLDFTDGLHGVIQAISNAEASLKGSFRIVPASHPDRLEAYWPLEGHFRDIVGGHDLTPINPSGGLFSSAPQLRPGTNLCYGPTLTNDGNGAVDDSFTRIPEDQGITMEGWVSLPDESAGGLLFGFGYQAAWNQPAITLSAGWGFIWLRVGPANYGINVEYPRIGDTCWHHLAVVLPKGFKDQVPIRFYLDGMERTNETVDVSYVGGPVLSTNAILFDAPFALGVFNEGHMKMDEVKIWSRELSDAEIRLESTPTGRGALCENAPPPNWAPGPRHLVPTNAPALALSLGVHGLSDDTIAVITDPNPFLKQRIQIECGTYLTAMENNRQFLPPWQPTAEYDLATREVIIQYRPGIFNGLCQSNHFTLSWPGSTNSPVNQLGLWPQATREFRTPGFATNGTDVHTLSSENVYYSYLQLPFHMSPGATYQITDEWSNTVCWTYDEDQTVSWALKVNQLGYLADAPEKYAYLGTWLGGAYGPMDLSRFDRQPFYLCQETNARTVFSGTITYRADESTPTNGIILSGEKVYQLDFSSFTNSGRYYIRVPGLGRSWSFEIGQNAMGEAFYTYARSLFHQRCGTVLASNYTAWPRGDAHTNTWKDSYPCEDDAFSNHSGEGWGLLDAQGNFPTNFSDGFQIVRDTATTNFLPDVRGGWHDAGDYDREWSHLKIVEDLVESYLLFPENFADGQANIPESGNGIPDVLDEATWGVEVWRRAQEPDGRTALSIESVSHPMIPDPNIDTEPYYLGLATHDSSLLYAQHAARLARGLAAAGATNQAQLFLESARRAYAFGIDTGPRVEAPINDPAGAFFWKEPPSIKPGERAKALVQLWLASGDASYYNELQSADVYAAFKGEVDSLYWKTFAIDFIDVALAPEKFPPGWALMASNAIVSNADGWLNSQKAHAHRKLWYAPNEGYFYLMGWGNNDFMYIRNLVVAWRLTGQSRYRAAALDAVDWMHGANPQGRVNTTGLGYNYVTNPLHDPSDTDGIVEPVPGINIYGYSFGIALGARTEVFGLFEDSIPGEAFNGTNIAQVPPPWNDPQMPLNQVGDILYAKVPLWRNLWALEAANPPQMEFTVAENQGPATFVTGALLGAGWKPSPALLNRKPKTEAQLRDSLWFHP